MGQFKVPAGNVRPVFYVHRPLDALRKGGPSGYDVRSLARQTWNHHAVEVGEFDPRTQQLLHVTRYNLAVEGGKKDNNGKAILDIELNQHPLGTKIAKLFLLPVQGWTSYSDDQIKAKAQELIDSHGPYDLFHNNCQKWAVLLFNAICDVKGSRRMRYEAELKNED